MQYFAVSWFHRREGQRRLRKENVPDSYLRPIFKFFPLPPEHTQRALKAWLSWQVSWGTAGAQGRKEAIGAQGARPGLVTQLKASLLQQGTSLGSSRSGN